MNKCHNTHNDHHNDVNSDESKIERFIGANILCEVKVVNKPKVSYDTLFIY